MLKNQQSPNFLASEAAFMEDDFPTDGAKDGFRIIQAYYIYCALYFYYY